MKYLYVKVYLRNFHKNLKSMYSDKVNLYIFYCLYSIYQTPWTYSLQITGVVGNEEYENTFHPQSRSVTYDVTRMSEMSNDVREKC